ncbi:ABC transporter permease [Silanimonas lenta]|jgi:lipopolysaccharide transport system permease protein|uniref:ABC transporter permease n=1 Tax=Silanimonas lenta TaxID=265429 RepID=UPI00048E8FDC|nr:ABC transporter permease [Silanimonas lenta]
MNLAGFSRNEWDLFRALALRDIRKRYTETLLGASWGLLVPLVMLAIYTIIFSEIFKAKWGGLEVAAKTDYAVILFVGLIIYGIFAESVARAPSLIVSQPNLVTKVVFPLRLLPMVAVSTSLYSALVSLVPLLVFLAFSSFGLHLEALLAPLLLIPTIAFVLGFTFLFASLGVFLRDVDQFAALFARVMQYLTPVLYPSEIFPEPIRSVMRASPLAVQVEQLRDLIVFGKLPDWSDFGVSAVISFLVFLAGYWWFQRTRRAFADVI